MIPDEYRQLTDDQARSRILELKKKLGKRVLILGHHYQREEVIELSDFRGDSYGLCQRAAEQKEAEFIVFCGVHFMAEAADIVSSQDQIVHIPDLTAGCPLANYADLDSVVAAWNSITALCGANSITPITYINSSADIKAFCGQHGGTVCTSSNALAALKWGYQRSEKIFFFPDQHLGTNTGNKLGIASDQRIVWDPSLPHGGSSPEAIRRARLILWKGHCHVHTWFNLEHVQNVRDAYPEAKVIVHPECPEEVVNASDANGSTTYIIKYIEQAAPGTTIAVGTELNLVHRVAKEHPDKKVFPLARSLCPNMYKINLQNLLWTLDNLGKINIVSVPKAVQKDALIALNQMLQIL
ncbi:quinolinate synthase NadA [candidate division KSB1 bacterium]|nr:quinolinate synthase NadA [candidate division KSB1 bacterium]